MLDNWFYAIPILFFGTLFYRAYNKKIYYVIDDKLIFDRNYLAIIIIGLYFLSATLIYFVDEKEWFPNFHINSYTFFSFTIYSLFLVIYLFPALYMKPIVNKEEIKQSKVLDYLMIIMSILGWYSVLYLFPYALMGIALGAEKVRHTQSVLQEYILPVSPLTTLASAIATFYLFYIAFFLISIIQKKNLFIKISLFIGSLSSLLYGLSFMTRDIFVFYGISFLFVYILLKNIMPSITIKRITMLYKIAIIIMIIGIAQISLQRFTKDSGYDVAYGTVGYIAQQPFVFSETIAMQKDFYYGDLRFPIFKSFFSDLKEVKRKFQYEWSFGTFIKDFYSTGGWLFLILMTLLIVPFFYRKIKYQDKQNFYQKLIINLFYFQFLTQGIFYFKLGSKPGNIYILMLIFFYIISKLKIKN